MKSTYALLSLLAIGVSAVLVNASDVQVLPPVRRDFTSSNKQYTLVSEVPVRWRYDHVRLSLYQNTKEGAGLMWDHRCIHRLGPKDAFVSPLGSVVLIEEWTTENGGCALWLIDPKGNVVVKHDIDAIRKILNKMAVDGINRNVWRQSGPQISADGKACVFGTKHGDFRMDLTTGELSKLPLE